MCRHLAYVGAPVRMGELLTEPAWSLLRQSWAPRRQRHGVVNADGFGVGWYADGDPHPARHRDEGPVWADETFADLARTVRSRAFLAAVRSATRGTGFGRSAAAPFRSGRWLFSHNGALHGWPTSAAALSGTLTAGRLLALEAMTDAALLWAMTLERLERGCPMPEALAEVTGEALARCGGRVNLLVTDGTSIVGTAAGASLSWRTTQSGGGVVVASEPLDDDAQWHDVPDRHLLVASPGGVAAVPM